MASIVTLLVLPTVGWCLSPVAFTGLSTMSFAAYMSQDDGRKITLVNTLK